MAYDIETNVTMPERVRKRASKYPWDNIAVGQSFFVEGRMKKLIVPKRLKPRKFIQEIMPKNGEATPTGLRIWRTS